MNADAASALLVVLAASVLVMALTWAVQARTGNAGIVDIVWTAMVGIAAVWYAAVGAGDPTRRLLVGVLAGLWSLRLTVYLWRRVVGHEEDGRYRAMREHWGPKQQSRLFAFFQVQALFVLIFSLPQWVAAWTVGPLPAWAAVAAVLVWCVSVGGESIADQQLHAFRTRPESRGRTCREGLWRYSRHPNYFFEWLHWFVWPLLAWGSGLWWVTLLVAFVMLFLLMKVTGIPYTEQQALRSRGEDYRDYQRTTSAFFPWFPKRSDA